MKFQYLFVLLCQVTVAFQVVTTRNLFTRNFSTDHKISEFRIQFSKNASLKRHQIMSLRGGAIDNSIQSIVSSVGSTLSKSLGSPDGLFTILLITLASSSILVKLSQMTEKNEKDTKPKQVQSLQLRFLSVFWLLRMADWLQGPYFYEVYSSKIINGLPVSLDLVSKLFLVGFATTGLFGPFIGRLVDSNGRKLGTLAYVLLYSIGALTTQSNALLVLFLGRIAGGLGTSLLFSAPEAWLVGEHTKEGFDNKYLGQTFGWAYAGDALVAITAGYLASTSASISGPSGPFVTSVGFLLAGGVLAALTWRENIGKKATNSFSEENKPKKNAISSAIKAMVDDPRIMLVGAIQALFEGAMYIFVLQWPPLIKAAITQLSWNANNIVPYGKIFSCFMACCLLGSSSFNILQSKKIPIETSVLSMLSLATIAMSIVTIKGSTSLTLLTTAFFLFEICVGLYFPSIGLLRSKHLPDEHRSIMMNLFGLPLNLIVVSVFLSIKYLGVQGAMTIATTALSIATLCMIRLRYINKQKPIN